MKKKGFKRVLIIAAMILMMGSTKSVCFARTCHHAKDPVCERRQSSCRQVKKYKKSKYCRQPVHHGRAKRKVRRDGRGHHYYGHSRSRSHH